MKTPQTGKTDVLILIYQLGQFRTNQAHPAPSEIPLCQPYASGQRITLPLEHFNSKRQCTPKTSLQIPFRGFALPTKETTVDAQDSGVGHASMSLSPEIER